MTVIKVGPYSSLDDWKGTVGIYHFLFFVFFPSKQRRKVKENWPVDRDAGSPCLPLTVLLNLGPDLQNIL